MRIVPLPSFKTMKLLDFQKKFIGRRRKKDVKAPKLKGHIIAGKLVI